MGGRCRAPSPGTHENVTGVQSPSTHSRMLLKSPFNSQPKVLFIEQIRPATSRDLPGGSHTGTLFLPLNIFIQANLVKMNIKGGLEGGEGGAEPGGGLSESIGSAHSVLLFQLWGEMERGYRKWIPWQELQSPHCSLSVYPSPTDSEGPRKPLGAICLHQVLLICQRGHYCLCSG